MKDGMDLKRFLDEILANYSSLYRPEIGVTTLHGGYSGELVQRTSEFLILKTDLRRKVMDGPNKGKSVFQYHYIQIPSIIGVTVEEVG